MRNNPSSPLSGLYCLLGLLLAPAGSLACDTSAATVTNLPAIVNAGYQVNGLNATGQLTGFYYVVFEHGGHAFIYDSGALTDLGTFGGGTSSGNAINSSGQVAGQSDLAASGQSHAFLYSGGKVSDLGTLGGLVSSATGLNDAGQVMGTSTLLGETNTVGFLYANGTMTSLGSLGGDSYPSALNSAGVVAGLSSLTNGDVHAFIYAAGTLSDLGTLGGNYSAAYALNDAGVVVGESYLASGDDHGFMYAGGTLTDLGTLGGTYSVAFGINNTGLVMGASTTLSDAELHGFLYSNGAMTDLGTLGGGYSYAYALNNLGVVVGESALPDSTVHAFLYQNGKLVDLNTFLPTNSGWELNSAYFINDSSRVVGLGTYNGLSQYFIMDFVSATTPPAAAAGPDQIVDCASQVVLDGSQSSAAGQAPLVFEWSLGELVLGTNMTLATSLPLGTNLVMLKVTDPCGVSAQSSLVVQVVDSSAPSFVSVPGPITVSADANCQGTVPNVLGSVAATDNCTPANQLVLSQNPPAGTMLGTGQYTIAVTATDAAANNSTASVFFTVADTTAPTILSVPAPITVSADGNCQGAVPNVLGSVVATDNCTPANQMVLSQNPAAGTMLGKGQYTITVTATDAAGNSSLASVSLKVADTTPPVIHSLSATPSVLSPPNNKPVAVSLAVSASDNCDPAPVSKISSITCNAPTAPGDITITGALTAKLVASKGPNATTRIYTITVQCTDASSNTSASTVTVAVPGK